MKKFKRMFILVLLSILFSVQTITFAGSENRISGRDRFELAVNMSKEFESSDECILINYQAWSDCIVASQISNGKMPIYFTYSNSIESQTLNRLKEKRYRKIYLVGGTNSISSKVENQLKRMSTVERISGRNRYDSNYKILKGNERTLIIASGENFADGLVSSTLAQQKNAKIVLNPSTFLTNELKNYIKSNSNLKMVYIVGGVNSISKDVERSINRLTNSARIKGASRYEVSEVLATSIKANSYIVASGENFADGLLSANLSYKNNSPILLTTSKYHRSELKNILRGKEYLIVGGERSVSDIFSVDTAMKNINNKEIVKNDSDFRNIFNRLTDSKKSSIQFAYSKDYNLKELVFSKNDIKYELFNIKVNKINEDNSFNYAEIRLIPKRNYGSIQDIYNYIDKLALLSSQVQGNSDKELLKNLFDIACREYSYDYTYKNNTAVSLLRDNKGICVSFSDLIRDLCTLNNIEAETWLVSTKRVRDGKDLTLEEKVNLYNHQINRVSIDGKWYFADLNRAIQNNERDFNKCMLMSKLTKSEYEPAIEPIMVQSGFNDRVKSINFDKDKTYSNLGLEWVE
ncbi:cell wall-binding repeat-containing protein (plasmid) [Finegoldia magna]|uniref:cell wall-binding repeat-containing protein n=1 Tax=Finegoldia magna TaxID=1260 RepID=UPI00370D43CF